MRFLTKAFILACGILSTSAFTFNSAAADGDRITSLPGLTQQISFEQYSGYLTVDAKNNRQIFYWFVAAQSNPSTAPLVWWSNGGPGCSGLIGFFEEMGPFRIASNGTVELNTQYAWNNKANMLFVEAPAGVGFSFSDVRADYTVGDDRTAQDNYIAIQQFLLRFPELLNNELYISSESYGGHYGPTLMQAIVNGNAAGGNPKVNLKGGFIGNPLTDMDENTIYGSYPTFIGHALVPQDVSDGFQSHCIDKPSLQCSHYEGLVASAAGNLDPYALDFPVCNKGGALGRLQAERLLTVLSESEGWSKPLAQHVQEKLASKRNRLDKLGLPYDPCTESYVTSYLDRSDVRAAIHVNTQAVPATKKWAACSNTVNYNYNDVNKPVESIWQSLIARGDLKLTVYSGDDDTVCATLGSMHWIWNLGLPTLKAWHSWTDSETGQVGGYLTIFKGFSFATVHTAGHTVPSFQPARGLELFSMFLDGKLNG